MQYEHDFDVSAGASVATTLGSVTWPANLSPVHFVKLQLKDATGKVISENFYWRALPEHQDDLKLLDSLSTITLDAKVSRSDADGKSVVSVTLHNPGKEVALMTHLQLRRKRSGERVLPVYYSDNYISLLPDETRTITMEAATSDLKGEDALVMVDGWNVGVVAGTSAGAAIEANVEALVEHWPVTGLPMISAK